jgi:hypothetical protein
VSRLAFVLHDAGSYRSPRNSGTPPPVLFQTTRREGTRVYIPIGLVVVILLIILLIWLL